MSKTKSNNLPIINKEEDSPFDYKSYEPKDNPVDIESVKSRLDSLERSVKDLNKGINGLRSLSSFIDKYRWIICVFWVCIVALVLYIFRIHYEWSNKMHDDLKEYVNLQLEEIKKNQDMIIENKFLNYKYNKKSQKK